MLRAPPPPRVLPPPPSQGQTLFRMPGLPSAAGVVPGFQHTPVAVPSPPTSSFLTSAPLGSFVHPHEDRHMSRVALQPPPPPPPFSPWPLPPSPPPSSRTTTLMSVPFTSDHSDFGPCSHKSVVSEVIASKSANDGHLSCEVGTSYEGGSQVEDGLLARDSAVSDLVSPPSKPAEEKTVQRIEVLCQFIAKHGPDFEDMARQKELGNPEFKFLFGGEPGSEAAVAHEYFLWMKRKYNLECKCPEANELRNSQSGPLGYVVSTEASRIMDAGASSSSDSDMDMEDDITKSDKNQDVSDSHEDHESILVHDNLIVKEQLHAQRNSEEHSPAKDLPCAKQLYSGFAGFAELGKGSENFPDHFKLTAERLFSSAHGVVENSVPTSVCPVGSDEEKYDDDSSPSATVVTAAGVNSESFTGTLVKGGSPFRLLQDYASDDSSENDDGLCLETASPRTVSPSASNGAAISQRDSWCKLDKSGIENIVMVSAETGKTDEDIYDNYESHKHVGHDACSEAYKGKKPLEGGGLDVAQSKSQKDMKSASNLLKVDEFGRLFKYCASDRDSDDSRYTRQHGKRDRSWSRSRSPLDRKRKRSPWRRKDKRSRSRSWSPRKRRSRSPVFRRGEIGGDRIRNDRVQTGVCFNFLRGRCYRGASCRYLHHDSHRDEGSRRYGNKDQYLEDPVSPKKSGFHRGTKNFLEERLFYERDEVRSQKIQSSKGLPGSIKVSPKDGKIVDNSEELIDLDQNGQLLGIDMERSREATSKVQEAEELQDVPEEASTHLPHDESFQESVEIHCKGPPSQPPTSADAARSPGDTTKHVFNSVEIEKDVIQQAEPDLSAQMLENSDHQSQQMFVSSLSDSSPDQTSRVVLNESLTINSYPDKMSMAQPFPSETSSSQALSVHDSFPTSFPADDFSYHRSQLFPPPPPCPSTALTNC